MTTQKILACTTVIGLLSLTSAQAGQGRPARTDLPQLVFSRSGDRLLLEHKTCKDALDEVEGLRKWKTRIDGRAPQFKGSCTPNLSRDGFFIDVTDIVPAFLPRVQGKKLKAYGPNCFNAALQGAGMVTGTTLTNTDDFDFFISSPLCRVLKAKEPLEPGDVGVVRNGGGELMHAFVQVTPDLAYTKNGKTQDMPFELTKSSFVKSMYLFLPGCDHKDSKPGHCFHWAQYYRCQTLDEYVASIPAPDKKSAAAEKEILQQLKQADCLAQDTVETMPSDQAIDSMSHQVFELLHTYAEGELMKLADPNDKRPAEFIEKERFLIQIMLHRSLSLQNGFKTMKERGFHTWFD